jgi:hypothetical protein
MTLLDFFKKNVARRTLRAGARLGATERRSQFEALPARFNAGALALILQGPAPPIGEQSIVGSAMVEVRQNRH